MITDQDFKDLKHRLIYLEGQVAFLYQHLGLTFEPVSQPSDDPGIVDALKKGNVLEAMKIHRQLNDSTMEEAKQAVEEIQGRLGL